MLKPSKALIWLFLFAALSGLGGPKPGLIGAEKADEKEEVEEGKTQFIGDYVTVAGLFPIQIEGVGLVVNLDNTGGDPPPSMYRTMLLNDMRKRDVKNPNLLLQSPTTALVLIRAALPPVARVGDKFDIEVVLPENSEASSLNGGWLMEADLSEQAIVPGRGPISGHKMATAQGPILISTRQGEKGSFSGVLKRGRVLGGGLYIGGQARKDRMLGLYLRNDFRSVRNAKKVADRIGARFSDYDKGLKKPMSKALTDQHIELRLHPRYKENYTRYVQVIRNIALRETDVEERDRMERLKKSLLVPRTASKSAMELEAIGNSSIPLLKAGLKSPDPEVRFYSADALAYLGDSSGAEELAAAAAKEEAFRVFALAALSITDDGATHELLKDLMNEYDAKTLAHLKGEAPVDADPVRAPGAEAEATKAAEGNSPGTETKEERTAWKPSDLRDMSHGAETRYGAFRTLWTLDKHDPFIRGEKIRDEFNLHVLRTEGEPMIHLTRNRVSEVVLFGAEQTFRTPLALSAGRHIVINAPAGSDTVTICRFEANKPDLQRITSTRVADIVRAVGELGASYPDVAQMLTQAKRQSNAAGRLEIDALPEAGRIYHRKPSTVAVAGAEPAREVKVRVGRTSMTPNLFPTLKPETGSPRTTTRKKKPKKPDTERNATDPIATDPKAIDPKDPNAKKTSEAEVARVKETQSEPAGKKPGALSNLFRNPLKPAAN